MFRIYFTIPTTPLTKVTWLRKGVSYYTIIPTPQDRRQLASALLTKHVGPSEVTRVEPVKPLAVR
jgi:hypothetical protein